MTRAWAAVALGAALVASCSTSAHVAQVTASPATTNVGTSPARPTPHGPARTAVAPAPHPSKVLVIVEENHSATSAAQGMPSLAAEARAYGYATDYRAATHPSLPNYLALAGGSTFGVSDDHGPASHQIPGASVFDQAGSAGRSARVYAEGMGSNCRLSSGGDYAVKHNPWAYFSDPSARAGCNRYDVPSGSTTSGALVSDIRAGRLPTVGMLVPNLCNDAHDCSLATADTWLKQWLTVIRTGPDWTSGRLAVVVTFDENDGGSPNNVLTVVISKRTSHLVAKTRLTHYSWTRYADELLGVPPLRGAATATSLRTAFDL